MLNTNILMICKNFVPYPLKQVQMAKLITDWVHLCIWAVTNENEMNGNNKVTKLIKSRWYSKGIVKMTVHITNGNIRSKTRQLETTEIVLTRYSYCKMKSVLNQVL